MAEKIKVPRWFDEWVKKAMENVCKIPNSLNKEVLISKLTQNCWNGNTFCDKPTNGAIVYDDERQLYTETRKIYVNDHMFDLIKAVIDGYEVEEEKGYVKLDDTSTAIEESLYAGRSVYGYWLVRWGDENRPKLDLAVTRTEYDNAPAWVKACKFVPVESEDED